MAIRVAISMRTKLKSYTNLWKVFINEICFKNVMELGVDKITALF